MSMRTRGQNRWQKACGIAALYLTVFVPDLAEAKTLEELLVEKGVITKAEAKVIEPTTSSKVYWNRGTRV